MRKAVYAGSFDPLTNGHLWMIDKGAKTFDRLVVAIGTNPDKKYTFLLDERMKMLRDVAAQYDNVDVDEFNKKFLVRYARSAGAEFVLRGIRSNSDYEFEQTMRYGNSDMDPDILSVFLMPPRELIEVSSSFVKGLVGYDGWEDEVRRYVPQAVYKKLLERFSRA